VMWEGFFTGYLNYGLNCRKKNEELISRNSLPHYKRASSFMNKREAAWLHLLPNLSRYWQMSESVQHAGSARHSTTGDVYCMRAVPVTPRWRVKNQISDFTPPDSWLFASLKNHLKKIHFTCDDEMQAAMGKWFWEQPLRFLLWQV